MTPFFSVIVPVYKVEAYLRPCVDSILAQTFRNFELILVDDGSPDGCGDICDAYAAKDGRVQVIHKENGGAAMARKTGLLQARADYVGFVDGDDWVTATWLETVKGHIEANGRPDIILFGHQQDIGGTPYPILAAPGFYDKARLRAEVYPHMLCDFRRRPFGTPAIPAFLWARIGKRELLLRHDMESDAPIALFEDMATAYECMYHAETMYICAEKPYVYRVRDDSALNAYNPRFFQEVQASFAYLRCHLGVQAPELARQINGACLRKVLVGVVNECRREKSVSGAARAVAEALAQTGLVRDLSFGGLPLDMKIYLGLLKCRLYRLAVLVTKMRM